MELNKTNKVFLKTFFQSLNKGFKGNLKRDSFGYSLQFNNTNRGYINGFLISSGIIYIEFDVELEQVSPIEIPLSFYSPICFIYCSKGYLHKGMGSLKYQNKLNSFQTAILSSRNRKKLILSLPKKTSTKVSLILVQRSASSNNNGLNNKIKELFTTPSMSYDFIYKGSQNLKIAKTIESISKVKQQGIARSLMLRGLVRIILAQEIQQYTNDVKSKENDTGSLTHREMKVIKDVNAYINKNFNKDFSISYLCKRFSISPSKLQEGFKLMHSRTVADYVKELRVEKAEEYIKTSDMNITQIVYSIGFSSRSYFSKIFKEKYSCSPSDYKNGQAIV